MQQELRELYQQVILDHNKSPRNFRKIENPTYFLEGYNPLCGDNITIYLLVDENNLIKDISFQGSGCAISKASASLMTSMIKGKTVDEAKKIFEKFHHLITAKVDEEVNLEELGKLAVFSGVREFPARVKCASLAWHTMIGALEGKGEKVSTE
ncbi:MAG: SUF system NifU family Fe-S cluster assembly protein [Ignavibacterium sp.]|nr:SUF system NifU family Fe-S cluster assembly protein [Ignavibacterium sp.]MCX7610183.1 SUF system NifU family Fe-S cluster assembly protein [Ignavibacterium sp.]MDW8374874.1 SUF system NifU family Fe-S cluster assembly protein [Ignavibacteriales bacterium]